MLGNGMLVGRSSDAVPIITAPRRAVTSKLSSRAIPRSLMLLLLAFFCNTLLWACVVEPGRAPDEWDHFDYIRHLAVKRRAGHGHV
jgi:hypothetical protein